MHVPSKGASVVPRQVHRMHASFVCEVGNADHLLVARV
jgi:hypothetical protein